MELKGSVYIEASARDIMDQAPMRRKHAQQGHPHMAEPTLWCTGFEPFASFATNPSADYAQIVQKIAASRGVEAYAEVLPVTYAQAETWCELQLAALDDEPRPLRVLHFGLASSLHPPVLRLELQARNVRGPVADNVGQGGYELGFELSPGGADHLQTPFDLVRMRADLKRAGPAEPTISLSAGTYVCNAIYYASLQAAHQRETMEVLFVHVPWTEPGSPWIEEVAESLTTVLLEDWLL